MQVFEYKEFRSSMASLRRRGGQYQKAAEKAIVIIHDLKGGRQALAQLPVTNHGENRISKAVKYDLTGACRLVTVQDTGYAFLCFVGDHEESDRWLDKNRGLTVRVDADCKPVASFESIDIKVPDQRLERDMGFNNKPLLELLNPCYQDDLLRDLPRNLARRVERVEVFISDDEIEALTDDVADQQQREALFDVLIHLRADDVERATRRVQAFTGELKIVADIVAPTTELTDSSDFQYISVDSEHYAKLIEHYAKNADYREWMLFMHPEQKKFVDDDYAGPTKLSGVSGSGKTCVVVRRAIELAKKYPGERVLVLTLNRSLANLIETLVEKASLPEFRTQIVVKPFFSLCQSLLAQFEPKNDRLYDDVTWKSQEHIDEVWREFYRCELNFTSARVLQRVHDSLIARGLDAESYIREEFDWIRSATAPDARGAYLKMERTGRTYGLDESFRKELLAGLAAWEEKMRLIGVTDYLGLANALDPYLDRIEAEFRCVLIDESQDFGTVELAIVRRLVQPAENDIFLCGDAAQQVSSKHQNLGEAGLGVPGARSHKLFLNYRNSREILGVAHAILLENLTEQMLDAKDFEVLDPRYANFSGPSPMLLSALDLRHELHQALMYARSEAETNANAKICIAVCGYSQHELAKFALGAGLPLLDGAAKLDDGQVFISDLENTKGFEFQCMVIVNCAAGTIPNPLAPADEAFRDLSRLYVAMTRARQQLIISYCGSPSSLVDGQRERFLEDAWTHYFPISEPEKNFTLPKRLEELRCSAVPLEFSKQTGEQYLYTPHALGCAPALIEKLRTLVAGTAVTRNRANVGWRTIGSALADTENQVGSRQVFGPEGYRLFRERFVGSSSASKSPSSRESG